MHNNILIWFRIFFFSFLPKRNHTEQNGEMKQREKGEKRDWCGHEISY